MPSLPVLPESCTHVLAEFDCLDPLLAALRLDSGRLKCTCLAVSKKWLALGTSAGGLHLIQREGWKQRLILTHKCVCVCSVQGLVVVWELQLERRGRPERAGISWEHRGQNITALCWDTTTLRVFIGDAGGKVSFLRAGSSKLGKGSAFVIFPVQTITTVDSKVVQLGYQDGRLLVSSLSRCYLCDTEREKFWRVGNKERDGEYGACFFPQSRGSVLGQPPLLYCARPGSRVWEASFSGEVLSTHQFKQLLACPPVPLVSYRCELQYSSAQRSPQSVAFPKLLYLSDQNLLTWTDSAIYVFVPQCGQVLLWTEIKDVVDVAVFRSELFCLRCDGHLTHLSLLPVERCVERLLRREYWLLAATICCMFQHVIVPSRARKCLPTDRLEYLRSQLNPSIQQDLASQLEEVILRLEPLDSASSSRRSSISSHESFNVLDCGIYRVISRRGSQSDEDTCSLVSQSMLEEERLKEFNFVQEEEPLEQGKGVSSFVKKTSEKISTLQMNSDLWPRSDQREVGQCDQTVMISYYENLIPPCYCSSQLQDPLILLDPARLAEVLQVWVPVLEKILGPEECHQTGEHCLLEGHTEEECLEQLSMGSSDEEVAEKTSGTAEDMDPERQLLQPATEEQIINDLGGEVSDSEPTGHKTVALEPVRVEPPWPIPAELHVDLSQLASLNLELGCFQGSTAQEGHGEHVPSAACIFLHRYFFLLDLERVRRCCLLRYRDQPAVWNAYMAGLLELTRSSPVVEVIEKGVLLRSLKSLRELQPSTNPLLLAHLHRLYEKHGESAVRAFVQFYPRVVPADVMAMVKKSHFLPYLDNLIHSQSEEQRLPFLESLLQPQSLRQEWLELALSHDAPQLSDTLTADGEPRMQSHLFTWGYGRLLSLLVRLPADFASKQKMAETCKMHGYWTGYLSLCCQLRRRTQAFSTICRLNDQSLLQGPNGIMPETLDEWKLLIQLSQQYCELSEADADPPCPNGNGLTNGSSDWSNCITPESLTLQLARVVGPDRALTCLQDWGVRVVLDHHSTMVCELLRIAEKRQRALIQTMLERCDRFLWSQQA
uniref:Hermansky-Pudlak syndrome 5 protein homolog n=1 Tax=Scleropages formosus TaxID=113540 RepID=A0A8C9VEM0_SCLFO